MSTSTGIMRPVKFHAFKVVPEQRWGGIGPLVEAVSYAEALGFDAVDLPEHFIQPKHPNQDHDVYYDKLVLASYLAAQTNQIQFLLYALVVPYHPPIQAAKAIATLDHLSKGRLKVTAAVGWLKQEFELLGLPFHKRGAMTDEYLRAMIELWTREDPEFYGEWVTFSDTTFLPKCYQKPHVPVWIGGQGPAAERRAVEFGQGWVPLTGNLVELREGAERIRQGLSQNGRDPHDFDFAYNLHVGPRTDWDPHRSFGHAHERPEPLPYQAQAVIEGVGELAEAGFTNVSIQFRWETPHELLRHLEWVAEYVMPEFRDKL